MLTNKSKIKPAPTSAETKAKAKKRLEDVRTRQNAELLTLLEKEQVFEAKRAAQLEAAEGQEEKEALEKKFGATRAKASRRIVNMSESHDRNLKKLSKKLGVPLEPKEQIS